MTGERTQQQITHPRLVVLLSGSGRSLENLLGAIDRGELSAEIVAVGSSKPAVRGLEIARNAAIPTATFTRKTADSEHAYSAAIFAWIESYQPHLVILAGFLRKLLVPPQWEGRILNIHPALLPESGFGGKGFYGHHVHAAVLASGASVSGATVHIVDNEYDHGPAIARAEVPVLPGDTAETLAARVFEAEQALYPAAIRTYITQNPWLISGETGAR